MKEEMRKQLIQDLKNVFDEYGYKTTSYGIIEDEENLVVNMVSMDMKKDSKLKDREKRIYNKIDAAVMEIIATEYFTEEYDSGELEDLDELIQEMICKFLAEM